MTRVTSRDEAESRFDWRYVTCVTPLKGCVTHVTHRYSPLASDLGDVAPVPMRVVLSLGASDKSAVIGGVGQGGLSLCETWMLPRVLPRGLPTTGNAHRLASLVSN